MLTHYRPTPTEVAMLTVFMVLDYARERGKSTTRGRISPMTLRALSLRQTLRRKFVKDWMAELGEIGWTAFSVGDGWAIIKTDTIEGWARFGSKRIRSTLQRIKNGDDAALREVAAKVLPDVVLEEDNED